ncbi:MAG: hypothetical protein M1167_01400 [Chloroflexi bacterium]|nr:hypothetical protein [Chloroflexota bacterium]
MAGAIGGIYFTAVANPPTDFSYWLPLFGLLGVIVANLALLIVYKMSK